MDDMIPNVLLQALESILDHEMNPEFLRHALGFGPKSFVRLKMERDDLKALVLEQSRDDGAQDISAEA